MSGLERTQLEMFNRLYIHESLLQNRKEKSVPHDYD